MVTLVSRLAQVAQDSFLPVIRTFLVQHGLPPQFGLELVESVEYYKVSGLSVSGIKEEAQIDVPLWHGIPPNLEIYRSRGHRRLSARTYESKCSSCIWGCKMPVIITVDHWNPEQRQYRFETFCYGPKSCSFYKPGPTRKVPGRKGMSWEEEDWVDEEAIAHRESVE
jgi:hypothetical protein